MIDHDAAADLWDRYKRGERNVFTRRLYTLQGQQAFDDIRKKYRADREFKQTVDRYIGEFERLLDEVSRDDRGQVVARTYLTSETGKVYTMLAHAAGPLRLTHKRGWQRPHKAVEHRRLRPAFSAARARPLAVEIGLQPGMRGRQHRVHRSRRRSPCRPPAPRCGRRPYAGCRGRGLP